MMMKKLATALLAVGLTSAYAAEEKKEVVNDAAFNGAIEEFNQQGFGTISGLARSLTMYRDYNDYGGSPESGNSSTVGLTINYLSPEFAGFSVNAQILGVATLWQHNPNKVVNNNMHQVNALNLNYNFAALGLGKTDLQFGRIIANTKLAPISNYRQKDQAFEGLQLTVSDIDELTMKFGWMRKFSTWSSWHNGPGFSYQFEDIADMAGADYKTDGTFFADMVYTGIDGVMLNIADYWSENLYNSIMLDGSVALNDTFTLMGTGIYQKSVGKGDSEKFNSDASHPTTGLQSTYLEFSLNTVLNDSLSLRPGYYTVLGENDGDTNRNFQDTFNSATAFGAPFMTNPSVAAGTNAYFLEGVYTMNDRNTGFFLYTFVDTDGAATADSGYNSHEFNVGHSYAFTKNFSITGKVGYAMLQGKHGNGDTNALDTRLFIDYRF
ncbi:MAG: hypothetical protein KAG98_03435 [Lentisphaeria bacterium]|nr:hypothetical protein [Lentisphaeria bacterium]